MKKIKLLALLTIMLIAVNGCKKEKEEESQKIIYLQTQQEVDEFGAKNIVNYTEGSIIIGAKSYNDDEPMNTSITNLNALSSLKSVSGKLAIYKTVNLTNLNGLNNFEEAKGEDDNFDKYTPLNISIDIDGNTGLTDISALNNLKKATTIFIGNNPNLLSLFSINPNQIYRMVIQNNDSLTDLNGLQNINTLLSVSINSNENLINLNGLNNLTNIGGQNIDDIFYINIIGNPKLENLDGLSNLTNIVVRNSSIVLDGIHIKNNAVLTDFCGLSTAINNINNYSVFQYEVLNNAYNPTLQDLLNNNCSN